MTTMEQFNKVWKEHTGADLTEKEAWAMVDFIKMMFEHADKNLDEELKKENKDQN